MKIRTHNLGFPRIGPKRELKTALESFWSGKTGELDLRGSAKTIREANWRLQKARGIDLIPSNDFSLYDHVLDTCALVGALPERFHWSGVSVDTASYFAMARGTQTSGGSAVAAMEMTKRFDTNYHYLVPEFHPQQSFRLASEKPFDEFKEAAALGIATVPVLLGPISFLLLGKASPEADRDFDRLSLLPALLPVYKSVLRKLNWLGASWVQFDEPVLALDLNAGDLSSIEETYRELKTASPESKLMLTTFFGDLRENLTTVLRLPIDGLHVDAVRAPQELATVLEKFSPHMSLSVGVVDGRNVWRNDFENSLKLLEAARRKLDPERLMVSPSCSLFHVTGV